MRVLSVLKCSLNRICIALLAFVSFSSAQAVPVTNSYSGTIDWISMQSGATDTYGIGIDTIALGDSFSTSIIWDNDPSAVSYTFADDPYEMSYNFLDAPFGGSFTIAGNSLTGNHSEFYIAKDGPVPTGPVTDWAPAWMTDLDLIPSGPLPTSFDTIWLGAYSNDWQPATGVTGHTGLSFSVELIDWNGDNGMVSDTSLLPLMPDINTSDFAIFSIEQWDNGTRLFEARGVLANNMSSVPEPESLMLLILGLMGLGFSRKR